MTGGESETINLDFLNSDQNIGYLPKPIPDRRDEEIRDLLSRLVASQSLAKLQVRMRDGHAMVLRAFAERMATAAIRNDSPAQLRLGLIALLVVRSGSDFRDGLPVLSLFYDAAIRLRLDPLAFTESVRQTLGDLLVAPFVEYIKRPNKGLEEMGYSIGADANGFRYTRNW